MSTRQRDDLHFSIATYISFSASYKDNIITTGLVKKNKLPAIVIKFELLIWRTWFLASASVESLFGFNTNGRIPLQADITSPRRTVKNINNYFF